jgi:alkylation response protein AidB-like acyl-CoA dehydrogenase
MDFGLSEEQIALAETVRRFVAERCPTSRVRAVMASESGHDDALWRELMDLGLGTILVPEEAGGLGGELLDLALVAEELGYGAVPGPFLAHAMATAALVSGDGEVAAAWLADACDGRRIGTVALGEAGGRWDADELEVRVRQGRISGAKPLVPYGGVADFVVCAAVDDDGPGLWLIERGAQGMEIAPLSGNDQTRRLDAVTMRETPARRLGGVEALARVRDAGLVLLAADAWGGSWRCLEMSRDYALERQQFGQIIGAFQAVKHQLADLATAIEPARSLVWYAAHAWDRIPRDSSRMAAIAKACLGDIFDKTTRDAIELHGGIGFTWEYDLQLWFRRAMFNRSYLGDATYHRARAADLAGW